MIERTVHPVEYLDILSRRRRWFIAPFALCVVGGALLAFFCPRLTDPVHELVSRRRPWFSGGHRPWPR